MLETFGEFSCGYTEIAAIDKKHTNMLMDIGIQVLCDAEVISLYEDGKEMALLLLSGEVTFEWGADKQEASRRSLFDENPTVLHVPCQTNVSVTAKGRAEILIQKTVNNKQFASKFYAKTDVKTDIFGENVWNDTARRVVRTVFDYNNAPYSNMVIGEVINLPGRWSSYIPHGHDQPEVYVYRFDRDTGFGAAFIGDDVYKIKNNSALFIPGGPTHPQVSAPGYAMYYCWMIRHLENNPWTSRDNDPVHEWLLEKDAKIWDVKV